MNRSGTVVLGATALVAIGVGIERIICWLSPPAGRQVGTGGRFMRSTPKGLGVFLGLLAVAMLMAGCGLGYSYAPKPGVGTAAPAPSGGFTWIPGCALSSEEVELALGARVSAPQLPEVPPMVAGLLQSCGFVILGGSGDLALGINVFDAEGDATDSLDPVRRGYPNGVDVPGIGDAAFMDDQPRGHLLWAVKGRTALHIFISPRLDPLTVEQFKALASAAFGRL